MTKIYRILLERGMTQRDLQRAIIDKHGVKLGDDRICKMVNGTLKNVHTKTAKLIASTLEVGLDDVVEDDILDDLVYDFGLNLKS
jgi:DNA-binding Xre family transcriptional regulator